MKKETNIANPNNNIVQETSLAQDIVQLLLKIAFIILVVFLIFTFLYGIVRVNDVSMKPAIKDGDMVLYYRLDKRFISGDVAVFEDDGRTTCGRVVAVAGDTVDITKNALKINGAEQISQDIYFNTTRFKNGVDFRLRLGKGRFLCLETTDHRHQTVVSMAVLIPRISGEKSLRLFGAGEYDHLVR